MAGKNTKKPTKGPTGPAAQPASLLGGAAADQPAGRRWSELPAAMDDAKAHLAQAAQDAGINLEQAAALLPAAFEFMQELQESLHPADDEPPPAPAPAPAKPRFTREQRKANFEQRQRDKHDNFMRRVLRPGGGRRDGLSSEAKQALRETHSRQILVRVAQGTQPPQGPSASEEAKATGRTLWQVLQERGAARWLRQHQLDVADGEATGRTAGQVEQERRTRQLAAGRKWRERRELDKLPPPRTLTEEQMARDELDGNRVPLASHRDEPPPTPEPPETEAQQRKAEILKQLHALAPKADGPYAEAIEESIVGLSLAQADDDIWRVIAESEIRLGDALGVEIDMGLIWAADDDKATTKLPKRGPGAKAKKKEAAGKTATKPADTVPTAKG